MRNYFYWLLTLTFLSLSCNTKNQESDAQTVGKTKAYMHATSVMKVCIVTGNQKIPFETWFEDKHFSKFLPNDKDFSLSDRQWLKEIVTQEFTKERTGLSFTGFDDCDGESPNIQNYDVYVFPSQAVLPAEVPDQISLANTSSIDWTKHISDNGCGKMCGVNEAAAAPTSARLPVRVYLEFDGMCHFNTLVKTTQENCVKLDALHEFGHVGGLRHSHDHPSALNDPACLDASGKVRSDVGHLGPGLIVGPYEKESVMSYCHEDHFLWQDGISKIGKVELTATERGFIRSMTPP